MPQHCVRSLVSQTQPLPFPVLQQLFVQGLVPRALLVSRSFLLFHCVTGQAYGLPWDISETEKGKVVWKLLLLYIPLGICSMFLSIILPVVITGSQVRPWILSRMPQRICSVKKPPSKCFGFVCVQKVVVKEVPPVAIPVVSWSKYVR